MPPQKARIQICTGSNPLGDTWHDVDPARFNWAPYQSKVRRVKAVPIALPVRVWVGDQQHLFEKGSFICLATNGDIFVLGLSEFNSSFVIAGAPSLDEVFRCAVSQAIADHGGLERLNQWMEHLRIGTLTSDDYVLGSELVADIVAICNVHLEKGGTL